MVITTTFMIWYFVINAVVGLIIYLGWKKPFYSNIFLKIKRFMYGKRGITIRLIDHNKNEYEVVGKVKNADSCTIDDERYQVITDASIVKRDSKHIEYIKNIDAVMRDKKGKVQKEIITTKQWTDYQLDQNKSLNKNFKQEVVFTYLLGFPLPLCYDYSKHTKKNTVDGYTTTSADLEKYMKKKIFSDKVYDDKLLKNIQYTGIAILVSVFIIGIIIVKSMFFGGA